MVKPNKTTIETVKTVVIAVLITGIVAFIAGVKYKANEQAKFAHQVVQTSQASLKSE